MTAKPGHLRLQSPFGHLRNPYWLPAMPIFLLDLELFWQPREEKYRGSNFDLSLLPGFQSSEVSFFLLLSLHLSPAVSSPRIKHWKEIRKQKVPTLCINWACPSLLWAPKNRTGCHLWGPIQLQQALTCFSSPNSPGLSLSSLTFLPSFQFKPHFPSPHQQLQLHPKQAVMG